MAPTGHGESYPVGGLALVPGDGVVFLFYVRTTRIGVSEARGYRVTYRTADGLTHTASGETPAFELDARAPADVRNAEGTCNPIAGASWGKPAHGFPR